jgi:protocatechuate 3,4-dioxygenase beta subunit
MARLNWRLAVAVAVLGASSASAQVSKSSGALEGQVLDSVTGAPIPEATVMYHAKSAGMNAAPLPGSITKSDLDGRFRFRNVPPGEYAFGAGATGYIPLFGYPGTESRKAQTFVTLADGEQRSVGLRLTPLALISGHIVDVDGNPLEGIEMDLWKESYRGGHRALYAEGWVFRTGSDGSYQTIPVPAGRYFVSAGTSVEALQAAGGESHYARRYYPGSLDPEGATPIDLAPGVKLSGIDFKMPKILTVTVSGRVLGDRAAIVTLFRETMVRGSRRATTSLPEGKFEFQGLLPGPYRLLVHVKDDQGEQWASQPLPVGSNGSTGLKVVPLTGSRVTGHIYIEGSDEGVDYSKFSYVLDSADRGTGDISFGDRVETSGVFGENLSPGRFRVNCSYAQGGFYVKAVRSGSKEFTDRIVEVIAGASLQIAVTMSRNVASVGGTAFFKDFEQPAAQTRVVLVPQEKIRKDAPEAYLTTMTDASGKFAFRDVTPGSYKAFAWESLDFLLRPDMNPYVMGPLESKGTMVNLGEGERVQIKVTLIPAEP